MKRTLIFAAIAAAATLANASDMVNPGVIFGSGNANGDFTIATGGGIELGLRAKRRYNSAGVPDGVTNYDGVDSYTFNPANGNPPANRAMWNFEFSINSDVAGTTGSNLAAFTYELAMFTVGADGTDINDALAFDPINTLYADHSIGDNSTTSATDSIATNATNYADLITNNNVAQNSWNYGFFNGAGSGALEGINPAAKGTYIVRLTAFDEAGLEIISTDIYVTVVPLPTAAFAGLGLLGLGAGVRTIRRRS